MNQEKQAADRLYKTHFGKMVTAMLQFSREIDLETAEDLVQDAFCKALSSWEQKGIPANPAGWIYRVCRNQAINALKKNKFFPNPFDSDLTTVDCEAEESFLDDRILPLLFACAHPRLSAKMQVVLILKYLVNLRTESIALALGLSVDGIDKIISRAKHRIRIENILLKEPTLQERSARLPSVHKMIYLIFNEGYRAASGSVYIRHELCEEALLMTKSLLDARVCDTDTLALYALLLFHASRLPARVNPAGELSDLEEQDRATWNRDLMELGTYYFQLSETSDISSYHYEAAIAYLHCRAGHFAETDWSSIVRLYQHLLQNRSNPFIRLNYAIALYYEGNKQEAFEMLGELEHTFREPSYLLHAALGKLYRLEGETDRSNFHLDKAHSISKFQLEKDFIISWKARH